LGTPYKITTYSNVSGFFMPVYIYSYHNERRHTAIGGVPPRQLLDAA